MLRSPVEPRQMLDPVVPLSYKFCFPWGLTGETEISCPQCAVLLPVQVNDSNGEDSYQCCKWQKGFVIDRSQEWVPTNSSVSTDARWSSSDG